MDHKPFAAEQIGASWAVLGPSKIGPERSVWFLAPPLECVATAEQRARELADLLNEQAAERREGVLFPA